MLDVGQEIDRYVVEAEIGVGGMAVVYRVRHRTLGTAHALKVLTLRDAALKERLVLEGKIQARLRHPNVVQVTDVLDVRGAPGLLMEFIEGPSLYSYAYGRALPIAEAEALFRGVLEAVAYAHASTPPLVHRDLKPANVLLDPRPEGFVPKVTDFGIAKVVADADDRQKTRSRSAMGTPSYMAPEQISDASKVDRRADIFSLGCILYELVTGHLAFDGHDLIGILSAVAKGEYIPPRKHVPDLPDHLERAIRGALVSDRDLRIADCPTFRAVLNGERTSWAGTMVPVGGTAGRPATRPDVPAPTGSATFAADMEVAGDLPVAGVTAAPMSQGSMNPDPMRTGPLSQASFASPVTAAPPPGGSAPGPTLSGVTSPRPASSSAALVLGGAGTMLVLILGVSGGLWALSSLNSTDAPAQSAAPPTQAEPVATGTPPAPEPTPGQPASAEPSEPAPAEPTPTEPTTASAPADPTSSAPTPSAPTPPATASTATSSARKTTKPAIEAAPAPPPAPAPTPVSTATARLRIGANQASEVSIDGRAIEGGTPAAVEVSVGKHTVVLRGPGGKTKTTSVTVGEDGASFCWDFEIDGRCP